nr:MAG TPA: hypothetical protein [Caudoviricetes sp.]
MSKNTLKEGVTYYGKNEDIFNYDSIEIRIYGKQANGALKINLDNYNEKLIDMLYVPSIKKILKQVIEKELEK